MAVFARAPVAGSGKTRLASLLGVEGAAQLQAALLRDAVRKGALLRGAARYLFLAGRAPLAWMRRRASPETAGYTVVPQRGADFGERLERAFRQLLAHHPAALVIGTDSPTLDISRLRQALEELHWSEAVLGPCPDGGYYLIGLRRLSRDLFRGLRWGTAFAFRDTLRNLAQCGFSCSVLEMVPDLDRPSDFRRLVKSSSLGLELRRWAPATWSFIQGRPQPGPKIQDRRFRTHE